MTGYFYKIFLFSFLFLNLEGFADDLKNPEGTSSRLSPYDSKKIVGYRVKEGENLRMISFKIYGDYSFWEDLKKLNIKRLKDEKPEVGKLIAVYKPLKKFDWAQPKGTPYITQKGDNLSHISKKFYGAENGKKYILKNNYPLVKDFTKLEEGLTLYILDKKNIPELNSQLRDNNKSLPKVKNEEVVADKVKVEVEVEVSGNDLPKIEKISENSKSSKKNFSYLYQIDENI